MTDVWPIVREERLALSADLEPLAPDQWEQPSLCAGWTVHDVLAHLVDTAKTSVSRFLLTMARARFDFDRQNQDGVDRERGTTPALTLERWHAVTDLRRSPPAPRDSRLVEAIVHGEDIRRPLGIARAYPAAAVAAAFRLQARTSEAMGGTRRTLSGLTLAATDTDLVHGDGPRVEGRALDLLLVSAGRTVVLDGLTGPGVATLRERLV
ncbi:maleylpyruvate isomerase family mycothiol-dependent enzyme [Nocardioides carbamazepini]|uniref:maleylpyruvate isomerase family mycothiol-dependent enzyme n=1 Tax=Nocardioides carbamazepini TaxID=2854259 RepID=UPI00214A7D99|nr:maleylpyruvate isomerase family mycothiol-dependent enzyme [Nocardioides carbamazepini]MCR1786623.1 maleylpyruvate isomerase family mycothiol-dependent enzyme [Nocardioides carbamazepini]